MKCCRATEGDIVAEYAIECVGLTWLRMLLFLYRRRIAFGQDVLRFVHGAAPHRGKVVICTAEAHLFYAPNRTDMNLPFHALLRNTIKAERPRFAPVPMEAALRFFAYGHAIPYETLVLCEDVLPCKRDRSGTERMSLLCQRDDGELVHVWRRCGSESRDWVRRHNVLCLRKGYGVL